MDTEELNAGDDVLASYPEEVENPR